MENNVRMRMVKTMYDELAKKLRHCENEISCNDCEYTYHCGGEKTIIGEAADAIEDLQGFLGEAERDRDEYMERLDKTFDLMPKWISVKERSPEKPEGYPKCEIRRTYYLVALKSGCVESLGYEFDRDEWQITGSPVVAWMPLPEPPKESES